MKTLIIAVNSKYIHAALAPWYLKAVCDAGCGEVKVEEYTINDHMESILGRIFAAKPQVAAFSCYIWNIEYVLRLAADLKKVLPEVRIILGGPEVSYDAEEVLERNPFVDYVLSGEGEVSFPLLLKSLREPSHALKEIDGLAYRDRGRIFSNQGCIVVGDLNSIPSPYTEEMLGALGNRIVYYESSRGCPFSCSYCLSSTTSGVRFFALDRVEEDLDRLVNAGVRQVKFVDRTFNSNRKRAKEIFALILRRYGSGTSQRNINFHFEAAADLFDEEMFKILEQVPPGLMQFEIGVQTTNERTLELINRKTSIEVVFANFKRLKLAGNIHMHLDLIAGLPEEDFLSFAQSFNEVYNLGPQQLQLGFLKMLKGSKIRKEAELYGYRFREYAPYEVLENRSISFEQLMEIKGIEELVERYYNSGRFVRTLKWIHTIMFLAPFDFYTGFLQFNKERGTLERGISSRELYDVLQDYLKKVLSEPLWPVCNDLLKFDFLSSDNTNNLPSGIERIVEPDFREKCFAFLRNEENVKRYLPNFTGTPAKQIFKSVHFEKFRYNVVQHVTNYDVKKEETVVLFNYRDRDKVTELYGSHIVEVDSKTFV